MKCRAAMMIGVLMLGAGCSAGRKGAEGEPTRADELREVATMLALLGDKRYSKPADLAAYSAGAPLGYEAVRSGAIVVVPGASMPGEGDKGGSDAIVAYEKAAPTDGGLVLRHNGKVDKLSADEFAKAAKFKP